MATVDNQLDCLIFNDIEYDGETINLSKAFTINYKYKNKIFVAENEALGIYCWGKNLNELQNDIQENLNVIFEMYVNCDPDELSVDVQVLRKRLQGYLS